MSWNEAVGARWADLLRPRSLGPDSTVVEIGPGFSDKLAFALASLRFRGTLLLVEPNASARRWASHRYRQLLPNARVVASSRAVPDARAFSGTPVDALVANHVFDDLLLRASTPRKVSEPLFAAMTPDSPCSPQYALAWKNMLTRPLPIDRVAGEIAAYVQSINPCFVALNHYPSWRHGEAMHEAGLRVLRGLESRTSRDSFADRAMHWLAYEHASR